MGGATYRTKQNGVWVFQFSIPVDCRETLRSRYPAEYQGQAVIRRGLATGDARLAERRTRPLLDLWRSRVEEARGRKPAWLAAVDSLHDAGYLVVPGPEDEDGDTWVAPSVAAAQARDMERRHFRLRLNKARARALAETPDVDLESAVAPLRVELATRLNTVEAAAAVLTGETPEATSTTAVNTLGAMFDRWKRESRPSESSIRECEVTVRRFGELHGDIDVTAITTPMVRAFRDAMLNMPTRISNDESAQALPTILEKYRGKDVPRASIASARKRLSFLKTLLRVAVDAGLLEESPADRVTIAEMKEKTSKERPAFERAEVETILRQIEGMDDTFRWVTILGAYTGCRLGEIVQLTTADIREEDGFAYLSINREGNKSTKTKSSVRRVPIHNAIKGDFLRFVSEKSGRIFDDITVSANNDPTDKFGKRWGYWRKKIGLNRDGLCFHSLRHSFKDYCRDAEISEEISDAITGHVGGGIGRRYGGRPPMRVLAEAMNRIRFPAI